eukprot:scaffold11238_cov114-Isochrysis_galbana.AAC.4
MQRAHGAMNRHGRDAYRHAGLSVGRRQPPVALCALCPGPTSICGSRVRPRANSIRASGLGLRGLGQLRSVSARLFLDAAPAAGWASSGHSPAPATCGASSPGEHGFPASGGRGCRLARRASRAALLLVDVIP